MRRRVNVVLADRSRPSSGSGAKRAAWSHFRARSSRMRAAKAIRMPMRSHWHAYEILIV